MRYFLQILKKAIHICKYQGTTGLIRYSRFPPISNSRIFYQQGYKKWVRRYDTFSEIDRSTLLSKVSNFDHLPLISIRLSNHIENTEELQETVEPILKQIYPYWELCITEEFAADISVRNRLKLYAINDSRITISRYKQNPKQSSPQDIILNNHAGDWVALIEPGTILAESACFWIAAAINKTPDVHLIYSDEDKIHESGIRFDPYFKCDWNRDLFYSQNLFTHFVVFSVSGLGDIGEFTPSVEIAKSYDLSLRYLENIKDKQIYHIPKILYHWRTRKNHTPLIRETIISAKLDGEKALNEHFSRTKTKAKVSSVKYGYRVHYALPTPSPIISLIIPTRNGLKLLRQCINSILEKTVYPNYEILIIDNASDDLHILEYFKRLKTDPRIRIIRDEQPFNYSSLNNNGVNLAKGELVGLLNNDLEVISPEWLSEMVSIALQPNVGAVGAKLWYPNDTLQHGGVILGIGGWAGHAHKRYPKHHPGYAGRMSLISGFSAVTGACLIVKKNLYQEFGGLDEINLQVACSDVDFCLRLLEAGYRNVWTPYAELYHHESATRGYENTSKKRARFLKEVNYMVERWGHLLLNDPAYSQNLTVNHEDFSLSWPPRVTK